MVFGLKLWALVNLEKSFLRDFSLEVDYYVAVALQGLAKIS
jgi:hypothetical protein